MKWERSDSGHWSVTFKDRHWLTLIPIFEWKEWFSRDYNWRNFHFAFIHVEQDIVCAGWEFDFVLLGVGLHVRYTDEMMFQTTEVARRLAEAWEEDD